MIRRSSLTGVGAAHALDLPLLEHAEKLGLHLRTQRADLVQEERSALGQLEAAELAAGTRAGERPALSAESSVSMMGVAMAAGFTATKGRSRGVPADDGAGEELLGRCRSPP